MPIVNFGKLGVIADRYKVNYYGETSSALHRTGTDRLWVTWWLSSVRVKQRVEQPVSSAANNPLSGFAAISALLKVGTDGEPQVFPIDAKHDSIRIEIPHDINAIVSADEALATVRAVRYRFTAALSEILWSRIFFKHKNRLSGFYLLPPRVSTTRSYQQLRVRTATPRPAKCCLPNNKLKSIPDRSEGQC